MLNIALPKGRLGDRAYRLFAACGYPCAAMDQEDRRLVLRADDGRVQYLLVKPSDVPIYVEHGAADAGIVGKDVLLEGGNDVYELLDLGFGACRMCVAAPVGFREDLGAPLRVATKYPAIAKRHYAGKGREIEVIKLNGSIELAPILGLSDVIVDIVETGSTLKQNHLEVIETVLPVSARLIANKASAKFKSGELQPLVSALQTAKGEKA